MLYPDSLKSIVFQPLTAILLLFYFLMQHPAFSQSIKGKIIENDAQQTPLFGATVRLLDSQKGTVSNITGKFEINDIGLDSCVIAISFIGYHPITQAISVAQEDSIYLFVMQPNTSELESVTVQGARFSSIQKNQASLSTITVSDLPIIDIPRLLGEPDLIRVIQNLPGVKTESDFTGGFHVRGGRNDQNLILLDGVPIYNPWHALGIFSAFNTEAIDKVELTKGVFPAKYGGRLSSVLDISLQKGEERNGAGYLTMSPLSFSFSYGRPLNQKTSYLVSARRTYLDPILWAVNASRNTDPNNTEKVYYNFGDFNFKVVHNFNKRAQLEAAVF